MSARAYGIGVFHRRRARGFTLIEIIVACAVAAIALGVVMIKFDFSDGRRLRQAAEALAGRLEAARTVDRVFQ